MPTYPLVAIPPVPCPFFSFIYLFKVEKKEKKNKRQGNRCAQHLDTRASSSPTVFIFIFWKVLFLSSSFVFFLFSLILLWCNTKTVSKPVHPRHLLGIDLEPCVLTGRLPWNVFFLCSRARQVCVVCCWGCEEKGKTSSCFSSRAGRDSFVPPHPHFHKSAIQYRHSIRFWLW